MDINRTYYGNAVETYDNYEDYGMFFPVFDNSIAYRADNHFSNRNSYKGNVNKNNALLNKPFDISATVWRINKKCPFINYDIAWHYSGVSDGVKMQPFIESKNGLPVFLGVNSTNTQNGLFSNFRYNEYENYSEIQSGNNFIDVMPCVDFNYKRLLMNCYITAYKDQYSRDYDTFSLYDYWNNHKATYPLINAIYFTINNSSRINLFPFDMESKEINSTVTKYKNPLKYYSAYQGNVWANYVEFDQYSPNKKDVGEYVDLCFTQSTPNRYYCFLTHFFDLDETAISFRKFQYSDYARFMLDSNKLTYEWLLKQFAYMGIMFCDDNSLTWEDVANGDTSERLYIPIFDEYLTTTGNYVNGNAIKEQPNYKWDNTFNENGYKGEPPIDESDYDEYNKSELTIAPYLGFKGVKKYLCKDTTLRSFVDYLYEEIAPDVTDVSYSLQHFLTSNPIDNVVGVVKYPFDFNKWFRNLTHNTSIVVGNVDTGVLADQIFNESIIIDMGTIHFYALDNETDSFLSYEPYTTAEIFIPYCGSINISPSEYMGHDITVKMIIDIESGSCIALVLRDNLVMNTISGQIGIQCPISGMQNATVNSQIFSANQANKRANLGLATSVAGIAVSGVTALATGGSSLALGGLIGGSAGLVNSIMQKQESDYELKHINTPIAAAGTSSPCTSLANEQCCRLVIRRPKYLPNFDKATYAHSKGFACNIIGKLENFSGYTECTGIDFSGINATVQEINALTRLLSNGVYL